VTARRLLQRQNGRDEAKLRDVDLKPVQSRLCCTRWVGNAWASMCTQVAGDAGSSQGSVAVMQKDSVSVAAELGKSLSYAPGSWGSFRVCFPFSKVSALGICCQAFFLGEKILGGSLVCTQ